jgi:hypothetical protein
MRDAMANAIVGDDGSGEDPTINDEERHKARDDFKTLVATHLPYRRDWRFLIDPDDPPGEAANEKARRRDAALKVHYAAWAADKDREMAALGKVVMGLHQWITDHTASSNDAKIVAFPVNDNWGDGTGPEVTSRIPDERPPRPLVNRPTVEMGKADEADEEEPDEEPVLPTETRNDEMTNPEKPTTDQNTVVVTAVMVRDKDTKNTVRYAEAASSTPAIGTIYLPKHSIEALGNPESITVTVSVA